MWPLFLYINKEECVKYLRQLELETYASLVTVLRAQGALTSEKRKILKDVGKILNITIDRHKCEIRRAINDEKLNTIAYQLNNGHAGNHEDWCQEGKRTIPVLQRISPQTLHPIPITDESTSCYSNNEEEKDEIRLIEVEEEIQVDDDEPSSSFSSSAAAGLKKSFSITKKMPNKNQNIMIVSNADTIPTNNNNNNNSILHKTLSVPISKVTKLKLDKFKIIPSSFSANVTNKNFFTKGNKKIIPLSQLQILNHKLSSKGGIKVLPINSKIIGKKITMTRFNNNNQSMKTTIIQPSSQSITVENTTDNSIAETDEQKIEEIKEHQNNEDEEIVVEANIENIDVEYNDKVFNNNKKEEEKPLESIGNDLDDLADSLMQIDCSELIET